MRLIPSDPMADFLSHQRPMILSGGLGTTLESRGHNLHDALWSARILLEKPEAIRQVHLDFLEAGADCLLTSTYQASLAGFRAGGIEDAEGIQLLHRSARLALDARDAFWSNPRHRDGRVRPIVAASVGPYGAFLADGSEFTGDYAARDDELRSFHLERWSILAECGADMFACETLPSRREADVLLDLLGDPTGPAAWMSFSCRDGTRLNDGSPLVEVVRACDAVDRVVAIGINCTAPRFVTSLIGEARQATDKPLVVYPNSGERYDAKDGSWRSDPDESGPRDLCREWARLGASAIGGCCRVGPEDIREMRRRLLD